MNFQSWKFCILECRKQLNTTDSGVFVLVMAMEIAARGIIFDSLPTIDIRYWIASRCLSNNFPRSIPKWIKTKVETITMAPRFKIDTYIHVYNFEDLCALREEEKTKLPEMKVWMVKTVRRFGVFRWFCMNYRSWWCNLSFSIKSTLQVLAYDSFVSLYQYLAPYTKRNIATIANVSKDVKPRYCSAAWTNPL